MPRSPPASAGLWRGGRRAPQTSGGCWAWAAGTGAPGLRGGAGGATEPAAEAAGRRQGQMSGIAAGRCCSPCRAPHSHTHARRRTQPAAHPGCAQLHPPSAPQTRPHPARPRWTGQRAAGRRGSRPGRSRRSPELTRGRGRGSGVCVCVYVVEWEWLGGRHARRQLHTGRHGRSPAPATTSPQLPGCTPTCQAARLHTHTHTHTHRSTWPHTQPHTAPGTHLEVCLLAPRNGPGQQPARKLNVGAHLGVYGVHEHLVLRYQQYVAEPFVRCRYHTCSLTRKRP